MRIQLMLEPCSPTRLRDLGLLAEGLGFEALWLPNILAARDPFLALAPLALESRTIRMGPVAISPFELHPAKIANSLLTLNELSGGRANIVIGGGGGALIALNIKPDRQSTHPRMVRGVRECVEFLRATATGEPLDFHGELYRVDGYRAGWAGSHAPPRIDIAANGPQMLKLAASHGDGVMLSDIAVDRIDATLATLRDGLAAAGRPAGHFPVGNVIAWHVKADREAAYLEARRKLWVRGIWERQRIEPWLDAEDCDLVGARLPALAAAYARGDDPATVVPRPILDRLAEGLTLVGDHSDVDRAVAKLDSFATAGVDRIALRLYDEPEESIRLVAERVAPAVGRST